MGVRILASVLLGCLCTPVWSLTVRGLEAQRLTGLQTGSLPGHSVRDPLNEMKVSSSIVQPYSVVPFSQEDALNIPYTNTLGYNNYPYSVLPAEPVEYNSDIAQDFSSVEDDRESFNDNELQNRDKFMDTSGYDHYDSRSSFNLVGPKQLETIDTQSYHKDVEPYGTEDFQKHHHQEEEEHAEVHYHQHKHLHKHQHKQEHHHKHKEDHKHKHDHKHEAHAQHEHKHHQEHKHHHHQEHKHEHHAKHEHKHKQEHKHHHHQEHKHEHHAKHEHKHKQEHKHHHEHHNEHKHKHHHGNKHDHHHSHKHDNEHKHDHKHKHGHHHGHKHEHHHKHHEQKHHNKW